MKKTVLTLVAITTILTACNSNQAEISKNQQSAQTEVARENNQPAKESAKHHEWSSLPEYETIIQHVDKKDYTFRMVTDNQSTRILLLTNPDGREQYKTIFIKNTNHLKIIRIDGEKEIYNAVLKSN